MKDLLRELDIYGERLSPRFTAVARHPLADETDVLRRLDMQPEECQSCDLYWVYRELGCFVAIICSDKQRCVNYWRSDSRPFEHHFTVWTRMTPLTRPLVEIILSRLAEWIDLNEDMLRSRAEGDEVLTIIEDDTAG